MFLGDEILKDVMFDTNALNKIIDNSLSIELLKRSINFGYKYYITHIQCDEINNIHDTQKQKRAKIFLMLSESSQSIETTETFVFGFSRLGYAKLPTSSYFNQIRNLSNSKSRIRDAIIGDTVLQKNYLLVSNDDYLRNKVNELGGNSITLDEFYRRLRIDIP